MLHVTKASHQPWCKAVNPLQMINFSSLFGELASIACSKCDRTMAQCSGIKSALDNLESALDIAGPLPIQYDHLQSLTKTNKCACLNLRGHASMERPPCLIATLK